MAQERWTKRCDNAEKCLHAWDGLPATFVPDNHSLCDSCLLDSAGLFCKETYDSCDREGIGPELYRGDDVLTALRKFKGEE
jgi:hypothetical protein